MSKISSESATDKGERSTPKAIKVRGARVHNLKSVDVDIPRNKLTVITGVSGSGKSSLAFDTIYAEGQRRYVESLSTYARQFLDQMSKPDVDSIEGLSPAIAIQQKTTSSNPRSTVATVTEIYDYLRLLYARVGTPACPKCGAPVSRQSPQEIAEQILKLPEKTRVVLLAPIIKGKKGSHEKVLLQLQREGFTRIRVDGDLLTLDESIQLDGKRRHSIDIAIDRLTIKPSLRSRVIESVELALKKGEGQLRIWRPDEDTEELISEHLACMVCSISLPELEPRLFSFNSPHGACPTCSGVGELPHFDLELIIPDPKLSLAEGAIAPWSLKATSYRAILQGLVDRYDASLDTPWEKLPAKFRSKILHGTGAEKIKVVFEGDDRNYHYERPFEGVVKYLERRMKESTSENVRASLEAFQSPEVCPDCKGTRLRPEARAVRFRGRTIGELMDSSIDILNRFFEDSFQQDSTPVSTPIIREIKSRLGFLEAVGLDYLSLSRRANTLSGGEAQRIRLATQIGSALMGVLYVLDEPSIGLHARDNEKLIETIKKLRDLGNTLVVVEHDAETIQKADWVIDMGPAAGHLGGEVIAACSPKDLSKKRESMTAAYLSGRIAVSENREPREPNGRYLELVNLTGNNLKSITVKIPLEIFVCVTGVSGSGKSTLVNQTLLKVLGQKLHRAKTKPAPYERIEGIDHLDKVIAIDQSPIGRTPRSNPATYTGLFADIRDLFANLPEAKKRGYKAGRFSFNVKGGRCETCQGDGILRVEMHFLPDVYVPCETCGGRRYNEETLSVLYRGFSIADILEMSVESALELLKNFPSAERKLRRLYEVGLGYIRLGQQATTLSGGEAQRIKLAKELARVSTGRTMYILDEPTTGLHFEDVRRLLDVLQSLVDRGNSVVVIEHDLDVIRSADWVLDLGPEGGEGGGYLIAEGPPKVVASEPQSHTGQFLDRIFRKGAHAKRKTNRTKRRSV